MDTILIAPMEKNVSSRNVFRETAVREDTKNLELNPLLNSFINRYRENLGIACLAAYLRQHNYSTKIINSNIEHKTNEEIVEEIMETQPVLVGFSLIYELHLYNSLEMIFALRRRGYEGHISLGGPYASFIYEFLLKSDLKINSVMIGEGELEILNLVKCLKDNKPWKQIEGIAYLDMNNEVVYNEKKEYISDLSVLPFAARDSLSYLKKNGYKTRTASIYSSRGCKGRCIYCTAPSSSRLEPELWRCRSGESLFNEVEYLVKEFGVEYLYFCDVNFIGYGDKAIERLEVFSKKIIEHNIKVNFHAEIRVDSVKPELLKMLKKAGLKDVLLGLETGSQNMLNLWRKGVTVEKNKKAISLVKESGLMLEPAIIMVSPKTTKQDLVETIDFISDTGIYDDNIPMNMFNKMVLFRGSKAESMLREEGKLLAPDMDVVQKKIHNSEDIFRLSKELIAKEYTIYDKDVQEVWEAVVPYINKLTWLIQEYFPDYMSDSFRDSRAKDKKNGRSEMLHKIQTIKQWRNNLGDLIHELLQIMKEELLQDTVDINQLHINLKKAMDDYEIKHLGFCLKSQEEIDTGIEEER